MKKVLLIAFLVISSSTLFADSITLGRSQLSSTEVCDVPFIFGGCQTYRENYSLTITNATAGFDPLLSPVASTVDFLAVAGVTAGQCYVIPPIGEFCFGVFSETPLHNVGPGTVTGALSSQTLPNHNPWSTIVVTFDTQVFTLGDGRTFYADSNSYSGPIDSDIAVTGHFDSIPQVPEPATIAMISCGLLARFIRRKK
jgi:hypothetical protein